VKDLRATLDKSKRALIELESEAAKRNQEAEEEIDSLREQLEAAEEEAARLKPTPHRRLSLPDPPEHLAALTERLDSVRDALLASDCSRDKLLDLVHAIPPINCIDSFLLMLPDGGSARGNSKPLGNALALCIPQQ
jgi:predicted nuclease with TOPRIM domain